MSNSKIFFAFVGILLQVSVLWSQHDILSPIGVRHELNKGLMKPKVGATIDGMFVYTVDTLQIGGTLIDDFSTNRFQQYITDPDDPEVTNQTFHALLDATNQPLEAGSVFTTVKTYLLKINLQPVITRDTTWFEPISVQYNNLQNYPVVYQNIDVYPRYILIDTVDLAKPAPDTLWINANLRAQDAATVYFANITDPESYWVDDHAHWNFTRARLPWSLGVVTFDGMDANGWPYAINTAQIGYADYLTSKPFKISPADANGLYLTFTYQPQGFGDAPEAIDSLVLDYFDVTNQVWKTVWKVSGTTNHDFKLVHLPITEPEFLQDGFRFRFKNYGGLSGDLDNWHLDYVRLKSNSAPEDTVMLDFAAVYPITSLLKTYTAVPWKHYRNNPTGHMNDALNVTLRNSNIIAGNTQNANLRIFDEGSIVQNYVFPGATLTTNLNFNPQTSYTTTHNLTQLSPAFNLPATSPNDTSYCFDYQFVASVPFGQLPQHINNDTIRGKQCFANYYAYDDGTAEQAYGIIGQQARLAYKFNAFQPDTLVAVQMHFVPTINDNSDQLFLLTVWADNNGQPGAVIYEDNFFTSRSPVYGGEKDLFWHYYFPEGAVVPVPATYYVGWRQLDVPLLNIGFDRNTNSQDKIFFSVDLGATWQNSSFPGSVMIRPVVTSKLDYLLDVVFEELEELEMYPNPFDNMLNLSYSKSGRVEFYAADGKLIKTATWQPQIEVRDLSSGFYLVRVISEESGFHKTFKIIKN